MATNNKNPHKKARTMPGIPARTSRIRGFYKLARGARLDSLRDFTELPVDQTRLLGQDGSLPFDLADLFVENAVGSFPLPLGIATSVQMNGTDYIVPMAVEESSVIAATSNASRWVYDSGGFEAKQISNHMIGQIQVLDIAPEDFDACAALILNAKDYLLKVANETHPRLLMRGGGARHLEIRKFPDAEIPFFVVHILLDTRDAMGANIVNTVCERLAPEIENLTGGRVGLRILSNLADQKIFYAKARVNPDELGIKEPNFEIPGSVVAQRIVEAYVFADSDPYRAATHNKGIMNGVDPVVIATGNDWRAIEAGAHAYAANRTGRYRSLTRWKIDPTDGYLVGEIEIPLQLGTVGGVTRLHPLAQLSLQILGNPNAEELGCLIACTGLATNLAALRALVTTGIQRGHMKLHAKNLALAAGAKGSEIDTVANQLVIDKKISATHAEKVLAKLREDLKNAHASFDPRQLADFTM